MKRRIKAFLLAALVLLTFAVPVYVSADTDPRVQIDKTVTQATSGGSPIKGLYDVHLEINGKVPTVKPADVVLVIDASSSMDETYTLNSVTSRPLKDAKSAAKSFVNSFLAPNSENRVAIVYYHSQATKVSFSSSGPAVYFTKNAIDATNKIDAITTNTYTNIADGFIKATEIINSQGRDVTTANRAIILLTDGLANRGGTTGGTWPTTSTGISCHTEVAVTAGVAAQQNGTVQVFTVGLLGDIYLNHNSCLKLAIDTLTRAQNAGYYQTYSSIDLTEIYNNISHTIDYAASNPIVTDKVPDKFEIVHKGVDGVDTYRISDGKVSDSGNVVTWKDFTVRAGKYTLDYQIRVKPDNYGIIYVNDDNNKALLDYTNTNGNHSQQEFPRRTVEVLAPNRYTLVKTATGTGNGEILTNPNPDSGDGKYEYNKVVAVTASAMTGSHFSGWVNGDGFIVPDNDGNITMSTNTTIGAIFDLNSQNENNSPPVANDDFATLQLPSDNKSITIDVLANDSDSDEDTLTITDVSTPTSGSAVIINNGTKILYTYSGDKVGSDSFTYTISDGRATDSATVTITIAEKETPPTSTNPPTTNNPPTSPATASPTTYISPVTYYTLSIAVTGQGTVSPAPGNYTLGKDSHQPIVATPATGWVFDRWEGDVPVGGEIIMTGNKSVTAVFVQETVVTETSAPAAAVTSEPSPTPTPEVEDTITDEEEQAPAGPVNLPKTGGVPAGLFYGLGGLIAATGIFLKKHQK